MKRLLAPACVLAVAGLAAAQTNRTMNLLAPAFLGANAQFQMTYPVTAAGNIYAFLYSITYPGVTPITVPGFTVLGQALVDPLNNSSPWTGVLGPSGSVVHGFTVPWFPGLLGFPFDLQSLDLEFATNTLAFADNELNVVVTAGIGTVEISRATSTSFTAGNNDLQYIDDATVGSPVSRGLPPFNYSFTRHRGDEGFVEGYQGTFSSTSHNSDIDSVSYRRVGRRLANAVYQVIGCPNGYDVSIIRDNSNPKQFSMLSHERATGISRIVPGTTFVDPNPAAASSSVQGILFYPGFSRDGQWATIIHHDSTTGTLLPDRVLAFRTDGQSPAIDITPVLPATPTPVFFDATILYTNDFLILAGNYGHFWTSATAPTTLQPLTVPNTTASNLPNVWIYPFSWRVSPDGSKVYLPIGSAAASRGEMDVVQIANVAGAPVATNFTQFPVATGIGEFGYSAITPSTGNNSSTGIKASVSPDGTKIAFLGATTTSTVFPGLYVADGTPNPVLRTVPGAAFYSEVAFVNNTTVLFFAGAANTTQSFYSLDVPTGTITQIGAAANIRTRGQFWSLNKNWWYFIRSNTGGTVNNFVGVNCATGGVYDVTGSEFGGGGSVGNILTGSTNVTTDPWFSLEMHVRRAPVGNYAYFMARRDTGIAATYEDANLFRFDVENGGTATMLTNNTTTGTSSVVLNMETLMLSGNANLVAWAQRRGTTTSASEDVWHLDLGTSTLMQCSVSNPTGQTVSDGALRFVGGASAYGLVWVIGTGSTSVPTANAKIEYCMCGPGCGFPVLISAPPSGTRPYQIIGTH
ncbi:MAG: hypothetical protein FJ265_18410 [Planctomycetes bacterium]|nr:hypothetical protein [Planctomycetota bacterium]